MDLNNPNLSFILISSDKIDDMLSILWSKNYDIIPIKEYHIGKWNESVMIFSNNNNDQLREDLIFILNQFHQDWGIIKYTGEKNSTKVWKDGSETPLDVYLYESIDNNPVYIHGGLSFSFVESQKYWKPTKKTDFKIGMVVEYFNGGKWNKKVVNDPDREWDDMWNLLVKWDKLRSPCL